MFYEGLYDRPAGMIYDCFDESLCKIKPIALDPRWSRYLGIDFGGVHTAVIWVAVDRVNEYITNYYIYREYLKGGLTARGHVDEIKRLSEGENIVTAIGGSWSEGQWRDEFGAAGLLVRKPPIKDVEVGIDRVYGLHKQNRVFVFDTCSGYLDEKMTYSRRLDDKDLPTEKIDDKEKFHLMDAERYVFSFLMESAGRGQIKIEAIER